jgi:crossover junction endodeoxyribonuclease RuvC
MKVLGIDPGSIYCGYGLIEDGFAPDSLQAPVALRRPRSGNSYLSSGRIVLPARKALHARLSELYTSLAEVIADYRPDEIVIEKMFFAKGIKAALSLGHTRGVVLLAASLSGMPIYEYSALEVKKAVVGYGKAEKVQVQMMVKEILGITHTLSPDSADALALALCHANGRLVNQSCGPPRKDRG